MTVCKKIHFSSTPTKDDVDLLRVLEDTVLSPVDYPCVNRWKSNVLNKSETSSMQT